MTTLFNLLCLAITTFWEQLNCHPYPVAQLRRELHEARQHNAQLQASISRHLAESVVLLAENERLKTRCAYLESLYRRHSDLKASSMLQVDVGIKSAIEAP